LDLKTWIQVSPDELEEMVVDLAKPSQRILIFVEEVKDGSQSDMVLLAKKIDPKLDRTMFVFTKFSEQLKNFTSTRDLNRYLSSTAPSGRIISLWVVNHKQHRGTKLFYHFDIIEGPC
jgi:hypothetical protein